MNLTEEFTALVGGMQQATIEFAVCGGMAMALHGFPRFTNDLDFLLRPDDVERAVAVARHCGFEEAWELIKLGQQSGRLCEIARSNKFQAEDHLILDFVLVTAVLEDVWTNRQPFEWHGHRLCAVSAQGLAKMKLIAGRPQDLLDIQTLGFRSDDPAIQP